MPGAREMTYAAGLLAASMYMPARAEAQRHEASRPAASIFVNDRLDFSSSNTTCYLGVCNDKQQHALGQAAVGVVLLTPVLPEGMRDRFWKRMAIGTGVSVLYEIRDVIIYDSQGLLGRPGYGFSYNDVLAGISGQLAVEGIRYAVPRVAREIGRIF